MEDFIQPPAVETPAPRKSRKLLFWLLILPLGVVLVCGGLCTGLFFVGVGAIKNSPPYKMALKQVQEDPQVIKKLGSPIHAASFIPAGNLHVTNDTGEALLDFDVAGPNGKAHVRTQARMIGGQWGLTTLDVRFSDGQRRALAGDETSDAPRWTPPAGDAGPAAPGAGTDIAPPENIDIKIPNLPAPGK